MRPWIQFLKTKPKQTTTTKTQNMGLWKTFNIQTIAKTKDTFSVQNEKIQVEVIHQLCLRMHFQLIRPTYQMCFPSTHKDIGENTTPRFPFPLLRERAVVHSNKDKLRSHTWHYGYIEMLRSLGECPQLHSTS